MGNIQNFVKTFKEGKKESLWELTRIPCILLFYPYFESKSVCVNYCHFDEYSFDELRTFAKMAGDRNAKNIALFGGYGSSNVVPLLKVFEKNGLGRLVDKDFISSPPVKSLSFDDRGLVLEDTRENKSAYSYKELMDFFY